MGVNVGINLPVTTVTVDVSVTGDSHVEGIYSAPQNALPGSLERYFNETLGCSAAFYNYGSSGDTTRLYGPAYAVGNNEGMREKYNKLLYAGDRIPKVIGMQIGTNNTNSNYSNIASNADTTTDIMTCIRASRNGVFSGYATIPSYNPGLLGLWYFVIAGSGTFTLTYNGQTTGSLAYNAGAAAFQTALTGLSSVGAGNAIVYLDNTSPGTKYWVLFQGTQAGFQALTLSSTGAGLTTQATAAQSVSNQMWQSGIVPTPYHLPSSLPIGTKIMVAQDNGTIYGAGVSYDLSGNAISVQPLISTSTQWTYNRKVVSGAIADQIWICSNGQAGTNGWYRTYCEEDYYSAGAGANFTPLVYYHFVMGLHLYASVESNGTANGTQNGVRVAQAAAVSNLLGLSLFNGGNCYSGSGWQDILFVDTFTPVSNLITLATPAFDASVMSSIPGATPPSTCDAHCGTMGNNIISSIVGTVMRATKVHTGQTWTQLLGSST